MQIASQLGNKRAQRSEATRTSLPSAAHEKSVKMRLLDDSIISATKNMNIGITDADIPLMAHPRTAHIFYYARRLILHYQHGGSCPTHLLAVFFRLNMTQKTGIAKTASTLPAAEHIHTGTIIEYGSSRPCSPPECLLLLSAKDQVTTQFNTASVIMSSVATSKSTPSVLSLLPFLICPSRIAFIAAIAKWCCRVSYAKHISTYIHRNLLRANSSFGKRGECKPDPVLIFVQFFHYTALRSNSIVRSTDT